MFSKIIGKRKCTRCDNEFDQSVQIFCSSRCIIIDYFLSIGKCENSEDAARFAKKLWKEYFHKTGDS